MAKTGRWVSMWSLAIVLGSTAHAQVTQRVNLSSAGAQANYPSGYPYGLSISGDGRYVAFGSDASNLVPGDLNGASDIFVRDRQTGVTEQVSVNSSGTHGNGTSERPSISADGRYVAFESSATNLVAGDTNGRIDAFIRDRQLGTTERVSVASGGAEGNGNSFFPILSAAGRYVVFWSVATNLVPGDTNARQDIFIRDRPSGVTERVSVATGGAESDADSTSASVSIDGRFIVFGSAATNLVPGDTNGADDVFLRDRQSGATTRVSVDSTGAQGDGGSFNASISADGRYVAFSSVATDLVVGDTNGVPDVFVRDRQDNTTERVSVGAGAMEANGSSFSTFSAVSADGRHVTFVSSADDLVPGDTNQSGDIFVRDRLGGTTEVVSVDSSGVLGNDSSTIRAISADGRYVAFESSATNLVPGDTNAIGDVFVRDREGGTSFTNVCEPGVGGVIACPCSNPSGGFGQGCDNSSATGGALLSAVGGTYLSSDSLVFITLGERPTALSIVLQGNALIASGAIFGQGVRCAGGALKRLYTKTASGGSITAPEFGSGDLSVSARSAAKGDPIQSGQSRWYLVYYRDPIVFGGCPALSTFNATQGGRVDWSP